MNFFFIEKKFYFSHSIQKIIKEKFSPKLLKLQSNL
jgi:hypothetical protein